MELNEYQAMAARTMNPLLTDAETRLHAAFCLGSEVGEVQGLLQKIYQGHPLDMEHVKKELGDVLWAHSELCTSLGFTLEEVAQGNIDKLKARYPAGFDADRSLHRAEGDI